MDTQGIPLQNQLLFCSQLLWEIDILPDSTIAKIAML